MTLEPVSRLCRPDGRETIMERERWLPVVGYEGFYEVSDAGRVRSVTRTIRYSDGRVRTYPSAIRKSQTSAYYLTIDLKRNGKKQKYCIHALVAESFIGPRPIGKQVAHNDGNGFNGFLKNIRYATPVENDADKIRHGTRPRGEKNGHAKLTETMVAEIRSRCASSHNQRAIASDFCITQSEVSRINTGHRWRHS